MSDLPAMRSFEAMGTRFECVLAGFDRPVHSTEAAAIAEEIEFLVRDWHHRLTVFDPASPVSVINALAADGPVSVDPELFALIERCLSHGRDTHARFDIAVGSLMRAHGFRHASSPHDLHADWGSELIELDPIASTVRLLRPGVSIDFGAIAKGFVLDLARGELAHFGVTNALIHGGTSSVLAVGPTPDARPWRVRILPDDPGSPVVDLIDAALSVSAPSGRIVHGRGHIMDPATGKPAAGAEVACVIGPSAEVCEAWSTALIIDPSLTDRMPEGYGCHLRTGSAWSSYETAAVSSPGSR